MFVSSFNTYINANTSDKSLRAKSDTTTQKSDLFSTKLTNNVANTSSLKKSAPLNYISQEKAQHNKQMIELGQKNIQTEKKEEFKAVNSSTKFFTSNATLLNAKTAYATNAKFFSLLKKPVATLDQTPELDKSLPDGLKNIQEKNMRHLMVNTYLANDKYYQITA